MAVDEAEEFLASVGLPEEDVDAGGGRTVRVRGLAHAEVTALQKLKEDKKLSAAEHEYQIIAAALVRPKMTVKQVSRWSERAAAGDFVRVSKKVQELSALTEGAGKSGVQGVREQPCE